VSEPRQRTAAEREAAWRERRERASQRGSDGERPRSAPRAPRAPRPARTVTRGHGLRARLLAGAAMLIALVLIFFAVEIFQPFHGSGRGRVEVTIPRGWSTSRIGSLLARRGVIDSSFFFGLRATISGDGGHFYAGTYRLKYGMSYGEVLHVLSTAPPAARTTQLTLIPGHTRAQVAAILRSQGIRGNYLALTRHSPLLNPAAYGAPRETPDLEGFLFPDTYQLSDPIKLSQLISDQLQTFKAQFARVNLSYARAHGLTAYDVLIIASMIEAEAATERDRLDVASVIYNRLRDHMTLGIDATIRYATGNYTGPLTQSQLSFASPYNTRTHVGLPPTPIDSPSLASIQAAAHPAHTNYLYFVVTPCGNGTMTFTASYSKFLSDQAAYYQARNARGGNSPEFCRHH
jgi:UPF0755 protein